MPAYRMYFLTTENHIVNHLEYQGDDDFSALSKARSIADEYAIDIWDKNRRVAMVKRGCDALIFSDPRAL
ncbi:MAG: hypothetical protein ABSD74_18875 [Rhizomicrobium sp.]|jgi:hypothetical protein